MCVFKVGCHQTRRRFPRAGLNVVVILEGAKVPPAIERTVELPTCDQGIVCRVERIPSSIVRTSRSEAISDRWNIRFVLEVVPVCVQLYRVHWREIGVARLHRVSDPVANQCYRVAGTDEELAITFAVGKADDGRMISVDKRLPRQLLLTSDYPAPSCRRCCECYTSSDPSRS